MIYAFINSHWQIDMLLSFGWTPVGQFSSRRYHSLSHSLTLSLLLPLLPRAVSAFYAKEFMINNNNNSEE